MRTIRLALLTAALTLTGCGYSLGQYENNEFVCEADGVLTERHVDVRKAWRSQRTARVFITYKDGQEAIYLMVPGETCRVERW